MDAKEGSQDSTKASKGASVCAPSRVQNSAAMEELVEKAKQMKIEEKIEGRVVINEAQEKEMITDAMKESGIIVNRTDHKKLKYFTVKVEALFACYNCDKPWSSHMGTIVVDLWECKVNRNNCRQRCKECIGSWAWPRLTEDRFKEVMDRVITKYWDRNKQDDDGNGSTLVDGDKHTGNPRAPHEQSLCERCMKLGRACW